MDIQSSTSVISNLAWISLQAFLASWDDESAILWEIEKTYIKRQSSTFILVNKVEQGLHLPLLDVAHIAQLVPPFLRHLRQYGLQYVEDYKYIS